VSAIAIAPPLPITEDRDSGGYFDAAKKGELVIRECKDCGHIVHLPMQYCDNCHGRNTAWRTVAPRGKIYSFTLVVRQVHPAFPVPYSILLIELDGAPGAKLIGHLPGATDMHIGMPMEGYFEQVEDVAVLRWQPVAPLSR
jgi:hypothetical protein